MTHRPPYPYPRLPRVAAAAIVVSLAACVGGPEVPADGTVDESALRSTLPVAAAALASGQTDAARRLYRSLADRFDGAPDPFLGLAWIALHDRKFDAAESNFAHAAARAADRPETQAEALLGAGRAALARGATDAARQHFENAAAAGPSPPAAVWVANGLAVVAALDGDYAAADAHYTEALERSSDHPRIAANRVRTLVAAGRPHRAARALAARDASFWMDGDDALLARLIDDSSDRHRNAALRFAALRPAAGAAPTRQRARSSGPALGFGDWRFAAAPPIVHAGAPPESLLPPAAPEPAPPPPESLAAPGAAPPVMLPVGHSRRLRLDRPATAVLTAAPEIADVQLLSPQVLYVIGRQVGRTTVAVLDDDEIAREQTVAVVLDVEPLRAILAGDPVFSDVRARRLQRGVALTGEVSSPEVADRALRLAAAALPEAVAVENDLRIAAPQQVNLEVQIAEVHRSITEDIGINWEAFGVIDGAPFRFRVGRVLPSAPDGLPDRPFPGIIDGNPAPSYEFANTFDLGELGPIRIAAMIDALATAGLANVLARPNVTAVTGETASFFSGGEYPLPTGFEDGVIVFEYKKYGVLLDFVPTVLDTGRIVLTVRPEVSEPSLNQSVRIVGVDIPVINVRRAETTVEIGDGESIVIAGLFRNASNTVEAGVPLLKDLPGVGVLFGHTSTRADELELIVVVTARLTGAAADPEAADAGPAPLATLRAEGYHY